MRLVVLALIAGCRCRDAAAPPPAALPHFGEWDALVRAAARADLASARPIARDLTEGEPGRHPAGEAAAGRVGAALAFVGFAEDGVELADAVAGAASGCGDCHAASGAIAPPRPPWAHETAAAWAVWGLVWGDASAPSDGEAPLGPLAASWAEPTPTDSAADPNEARVARLIVGCAGCHGEGR